MGTAMTDDGTGGHAGRPPRGALPGRLVFLAITAGFTVAFAGAMYALVALRGTYGPWLAAHRAVEGTWQYDAVQAAFLAVTLALAAWTWSASRGGHRWVFLGLELCLLASYHSEIGTLLARYVRFA